jgi:hypothetical protein
MHRGRSGVSGKKLAFDEAIPLDELLDDLLAHFDRRTQDAHRRFDELARARRSLSPRERRVRRESLRAQAAEIRSELIRLKLAGSFAKALLSRPSSQGREHAL